MTPVIMPVFPPLTTRIVRERDLSECHRRACAIARAYAAIDAKYPDRESRRNVRWSVRVAAIKNDESLSPDEKVARLDELTRRVKGK